MKLNIKSLVFFSIYLLAFLSLASCGDSVDSTPTVNASVESPLLEQKVPTISASSLPKKYFNYKSSSIIDVSRGASAVVDLPDQSKTIIGNIMLALTMTT